MACTPAYEPIIRRHPRLVLDHHLAACKAAQRAGYRWGFGLDDTLQALQNGPVMLGTRWYEGMDNPRSVPRVPCVAATRCA
jgi:hypothetical protein